jgi:hypothetical protein
VENPVTISDIPSIMNDFKTVKAWVTDANNDQVEINIPTGIIINKNRTNLFITFKTENKWTLHFGEVAVDLEELQIDSIYFTKEDVLAVVKIVNKIKICKGKVKSDRVTVRTNVVEHVSENGEEIQTVRTNKCKRVLTFPSHAFTCDICQKINVVTPLKASDFMELTKTDANDMEEIMNTVLPQANDEQKEFITEQLKIMKAKGPNGYR